MPASCALLVPLPFFPSRAQLEPLCPDGFLEVSDFDETAEVRWKGLSVKLSRVPPSHVAERVQAVIAHAQQNGGNAALETRLMHTLAVYECEVSPDFDDDGRAMRVVSGIVDASGGLLFFDGELFAAGGRALLLGGEALVPPTPERVRDRAHVLLALSMRGLLEQDKGTPDEAEAEALRVRLHDWVESGLLEELEPEEREFLATPIGQAPPQLVIDAVWRAEGAQVLLWALSARPLPAFDAQEHPYSVAKESGVMSALPAALQKPKLRSAESLEAQRKQLLGLHWRLRELGVRPGPVDFVKFSKSAWFGAFSLEGVKLKGTDLAIPEDVKLASSIAHERHLAANWLIGVNEVYSAINTPT